MGFAILVRLHLYIESGPWSQKSSAIKFNYQSACRCPYSYFLKVLYHQKTQCCLYKATVLSLSEAPGIKTLKGVLVLWFCLVDNWICCNPLAPGRCENNFKSKIFKLYHVYIKNSSLGTHCEIALRWMPQNLINEKSTLVQVMACCR